ncbi:MAG: PKD domain-containing protein, partial [Methanocorpusculum sp.]|nr:PKD domain-containing protein [Methanocorpusculum sp.]
FKTAAGNEINAVSLTMDAPATGSTVSTDVSKVRKESDAKYTVKSLSWHEGTDTTKNTLETSASFTSGKTYSVKIELTANEGYTFKDGITKSAVTVNSDEIGANPTVSADKKTLTLSYTFPQITSKITTVKLTINRPAANTTPSTSTSIVTPETSAKYTVKTVSWTEKGASAAASKFEDGKEYTVTIVLESSSGYSFDSSIRKEDVTVNSSSSESAAVEETDGKSALTVKYTMKASVKPVITITPDPSSPKIPVGGSLVTVSFRYTITGNYESGSINFGDNSGTAALSTSGSGTVTHSYSNTGTYTVKAAVYDKTGLELSTQTTSVTVGKDELTASFNSSPSSEDPYTVSFSATTSGTVTKWEWDLGDGTMEYTKSFTHTYKKAGDYTVQLTVYNGGIKDSTTKTITVVKSTASSGSSDDDDPFLVIGDTEVPSFFDIIAEFVHLLRSLFDGTLFSSGSDE